MINEISPVFLMKMTKDISEAIWAQFPSYKEARFYIKKWHNEFPNDGWENFHIVDKNNHNRDIDLLATLHEVDSETLIKIAIDLGVETPGFIPSIPKFRNTLKDEYKAPSVAFESAFKQIETSPDQAISLANSTLEGIIKQILNDNRIETKLDSNQTLNKLTESILKEFELYPNSDLPKEIKTIGSSLLNINKNIEKLRSEKTNSHGKLEEHYIIDNSLYAYFIVNSIATVGLFMDSFYKEKYTRDMVWPNFSKENSHPFPGSTW